MDALNATAEAPARLAARGLCIRAGDRELVLGLELELRPGEFLAILGRNGSGKTLTLLTLAQLREPAAGSIALGGVPAASLPRVEIARRLGVLPQDLEPGQSMTALESVLVGRHPHLALWRWNGQRDSELALEALASVGLREQALRPLTSLSGGEQRRVAVAALLAQDPPITLLDEPTNHLDPNQAIDVLELFRARARAGHSVIATLHDPTLAARYADRVLLLFGDGRWQSGEAGELLSGAQLGELYGARIGEARVGERRVFYAE